MRIDERYYRKDMAFKRMRPLGKFLFHTGACALYLDYQVWRVHFHWWHPITWVAYIGYVLAHGIANEGEIRSEMFLSKEKRVYPYWNAP